MTGGKGAAAESNAAGPSRAGTGQEGSPERAELGTPEQCTPARPQQASPEGGPLRGGSRCYSLSGDLGLHALEDAAMHIRKMTVC